MFSLVGTHVMSENGKLLGNIATHSEKHTQIIDLLVRQVPQRFKDQRRDIASGGCHRRHCVKQWATGSSDLATHHDGDDGYDVAKKLLHEAARHLPPRV
jgi:hypothetical protein